ncbi:NUDIX hydrolase [Alloiococcus sp. CFN-8]|uniref:NUDIX hydrolase n=1 Tax=Alloiococcus sp. CFN-8 TaxID=3416081 RepID=UPI003CF3F5EC
MDDKELFKAHPSTAEEECFDIFDEKMEHIGIAPRREAHRRGLWHKVIQCWLFKREKDKTYIILQKRSPLKDNYPSLFDTSAAGHIRAGEEIEEGVREIYEEIGISVDYSELTFLEIVKQKKEKKDLMDYQFAYLYIYECNKPLLHYTLQKEEVEALVEIELTRFKELIEGNVLEVEGHGITLDEGGNNKAAAYTIAFESLVPHGRAYFKKVYEGIVNYLQE